ncbi:MAG: hypothetical protein KDD89_16510, partial [Anaerolineales bacterium]|nr:hypothetical protein [Anaerolineales bacterium]
YYLTCFNGIAHTTAEVIPDPGYPAPLSSFTANGQAPLFTTPNTPFTLQWYAAHGSNCRASGGWSGYKSTNGTQTVAGVSAGKHLFTLTCGAETLSVLVVAEP